MSGATPSGPPPSGPPAGPPPGPGAGPPSSGGAAGGSGISLNRNQLIGIGIVVALIVGVLVGVLAAGGGGDDKAGGKAEQPIKLEPISATSDAPFTPPLSPDTATPPTLAPPVATGQPFGGTGDNTLCDREALIAFLTDPANSSQGREWARVVGIPVANLATYIRELIPTVLASDTRVTNHTFKNGRAIALQSVLQAGTAVLVDQYGKLVARCRCGNPLLEPTTIRNPKYTGPKWPGFDPTVIVIVVPSPTPVFTPGGVTEPSAWTVNVTARGNNVRGTRDSVVTVEWSGNFTVSGTSISGRGTGTVRFDGGCYADNGEGAKLADHRTSASFDVQISGTANGTIPSRTYALTFSAQNFAVTGTGAPECAGGTNPQGFIDGTTEIFEPADVPAKDGATSFSRGDYSGSLTLAG